MRTKDYSQNEVWVYPKTSLFSDQTAGDGGGNAGAGDSGNPPASPSTPPVDQGTNWEAAYKTLQRNHSTLQAQVATLQGQNETLNTDLATRANEINSLTAQTSQQTETVNTLTTQLQGLETERGSLSATLERQNLIMGEFPQLASFEAQGLLPQAEGAEGMREVFTKFAATIDGIRTTAVENLMEGASPEPVGGQGDGDGKPVTLNSDQLWTKIVELSSDPSRGQEYEKTYQEYLSALETEQGEISGIME